MNASLLIHAIVRQTTVLIATLATTLGQRAQLAQVANVVFADLGAREQLPAAPDRRILTEHDANALFWFCSATKPTKGATYTMTNVTLTDASLSFTYAPNEMWNHWCETERPVCQPDASCQALPMCACTNGACTADLRLTLTVELRLVAHVLEGHFGNGVGADLRLRRVD